MDGVLLRENYDYELDYSKLLDSTAIIRFYEIPQASANVRIYCNFTDDISIMHNVESDGTSKTMYVTGLPDPAIFESSKRRFSFEF
jgi:hypothetical protein